MKHAPADPEMLSVEDEKFDRIYPAAIRDLSAIFWTPVAVAAEAAPWLVTTDATRVLDIGSGAGKFCLVAAATSNGRFTGVEQRPELVEAANAARHALDLTEVEFLHANVLEIDFAQYEAFYLFNPFEENMHGHQIGTHIPLSPALFTKYTRHVAAQLGARPLGTRVVTFMAYADDIPSCYDCVQTRFGDDLKLWIKERPETDRPGLRRG